MTAYNPTKRARERFGRILQMHANDRKDIDCCYAGDIAAVVSVKNTTTGDTFCDEKAPIVLESMEFPEPVIRVAIEPKTKAGRRKDGYRPLQARRRRPDLHVPTPMATQVRPSSQVWVSSTSRLS